LYYPAREFILTGEKVDRAHFTGVMPYHDSPQSIGLGQTVIAGCGDGG
jgi:hypothetical protein